MEPQAADHALKEMFGPLLGKRATPTTEPNQQSTAERPNKSGKQNEGGKGKGPNKRQPGRYRSGGRNSLQGDQDGGLNREAFKLVARALVHQQEAIDTLRLSTGWIWWLRIPEPTVIPTLIEAAEMWREQVTKKDSKLRDTPLKQAMFWSLMQFVINTLEQPSEANNTLAKNSGWIDGNGRWVFQRWNPEMRALEVDSSRSALSHEELLRIIKEIQSLIHPETLSRFHVLRQLEPQMEGQTVRVMMDIALRCPEATQLFQGLTALQGNSALQLVGLQFKRSTMQRPPLIKQHAALEVHAVRLTATPGGFAVGTLHCKFSDNTATSADTPFLEWNIPATHTELTLDVSALASLPLPLEQDPTAEHLAHFFLQTGKASFHDISRLLDLLPEKTSAKRRGPLCLDGANRKCFSTGAFTFSHSTGVQNNATLFPRVTAALAGIMRGMCPEADFASLMLQRNIQLQCHRDIGNVALMHWIKIPSLE
ncbi:unnamed protein product, partial [Symbiodinium sp. KB8]